MLSLLYKNNLSLTCFGSANKQIFEQLYLQGGMGNEINTFY